MKMPPYIINKKKNPNWRGVLDLCIADIKRMAEQGNLMVVVSDIIRSLDQNAKMWPMLKDFADHAMLEVDGVMLLVEPEDWKDVLTAAFEQETRVAVGLDGRKVLLGARTSQYGQAKMSEFIEFMYAAGSERGVVWSEQSKDHMTRYSKVRH